MTQLTDRIFGAVTQLDAPTKMSDLNDYAEARRIVKGADPDFLEALDMAHRRHSSGETATGGGVVNYGGSSYDGGDAAAQAAGHGADPLLALRVFDKAKAVLREQWAEFMLVDLKGFAQRSKLRAIIFRTFRRTTDAERTGLLTHRSPVWLEAMTQFLRLVRELMRVHFFSCLYDEFPRCRLPIKGTSEYVLCGVHAGVVCEPSIFHE
jgi:hypothetical protein